MEEKQTKKLKLLHIYQQYLLVINQHNTNQNILICIIAMKQRTNEEAHKLLKQAIKTYQTNIQKNKVTIIQIGNSNIDAFYKFTREDNVIIYACKCKQNKKPEQLILYLIKLCIARPGTDKLKSQNYIGEAFAYCIKIGNLDFVRIFKKAGFDIHRVLLTELKIDLNGLDLAILYGEYQIALYLYQDQSSNKKLKPEYQYQKFRNKYQYSYKSVNYQKIIEGLKANANINDMNNFRKQTLDYWVKNNIIKSDTLSKLFAKQTECQKADKSAQKTNQNKKIDKKLIFQGNQTWEVLEDDDDD